MNRADAGAGEHRDRELGNHRQVDRHAIAFLDAELLERARAHVDLPPHVAVGQHTFIAGLSLPDECGLVTNGAVHMPVETVYGNVGLAPDIPLVERGIARVEHLVPLLVPEQLLGGLPPERLRVVDALLVHFLILIERRYMRLFFELFGRWERAAFFQHAIQMFVGHDVPP